ASAESLLRLDDAARFELDETVEALAPAVDLSMDVACPECGAVNGVDVDIAPFLLQELYVPARQLLREVHTLAFHYRWSETEILALPRAKRRRYLELIADELRRELES